MSSTPRSHQLRHERARRRRGVQPVFASTRIGPSKTSRTASSVARSAGPPTLIFSAGKSRPARRPLGDDLRLVDAQREVGRRHVGREPEQLVDRHAEALADEVVERDVERALRGPVVADRARPCSDAGDLERRAASARSAGDRSIALEQQRQDGRHRLGRLAVVSGPGSPRRARPGPGSRVVAQLDDDGRDPSAARPCVRRGRSGTGPAARADSDLVA